MKSPDKKRKSQDNVIWLWPDVGSEDQTVGLDNEDPAQKILKQAMLQVSDEIGGKSLRAKVASSILQNPDFAALNRTVMDLSEADPEIGDLIYDRADDILADWRQ
jgi:hypothetical protein